MHYRWELEVARLMLMVFFHLREVQVERMALGMEGGRPSLMDELLIGVIKLGNELEICNCNGVIR
jgi:hypothetical protein